MTTDNNLKPFTHNAEGAEPLADLLAKTVEQIEFRLKNKGAYSGVPSGFYGLDEFTMGFQKPDLIVLAARSLMGKTIFAQNVALNVASAEKIPMMLFSIELSKIQLTKQIICSIAEVDAQRVRVGELSVDEWKKITDATESLQEIPLYIDDTAGISVCEIRTKCLELKKREPHLGLIIVDYLQLMEDIATPDSILRGLKSLARELDVPIVVLSQLSRRVESRKDKRPMLSDFREGDEMLQQIADVIMFLYREEYYDKSNSEFAGKAELIVAKNKNGPTGTVGLNFKRDILKFENY